MSPRVLHVMNGDSMRPILASSGLDGDLVVHADPLYEGPVPAGLSDQQLREVRATYWASFGGATYNEMLAVAVAADAALERYPEYDELVLWFEHDLLDQLQLVRLLDWFWRRPARPLVLSLVSINAFPGTEPFLGLGQLNGQQLASLYGGRSDVTEAQLELAHAAWTAFTSPDPTELQVFLSRDKGELPFLAPALRRWLEEFPAVGSGLPRTERQILTVLAAAAVQAPTQLPVPEEAPAVDADRAEGEGQGDLFPGELVQVAVVHSPGSLFHAVHDREQWYYVADLQFRGRLDALAAPDTPLIDLQLESGAGDTVLPEGLVTITDLGRDVLAGREDWLALRPFDRWMGGVHLQGTASWRWDAALGTLVRNAS